MTCADNPIAAEANYASSITSAVSTLRVLDGMKSGLGAQRVLKTAVLVEYENMCSSHNVQRDKFAKSIREQLAV